MNQEQNLKWLILSGVSETVGESPVNRLAGKKAILEPVLDSTPSPVASDDTFVRRAEQVAAEAESLTDLYRRRAEFDGCPLKKTALHTLNGRGVPLPDILCMTDTPDTADEKAGQLFGGETGTLLDKMLAAIGLNLSQNAYVSSLIPWRPPGNRKPTEAELAVCRPFWEREIDFLKPKVLLLFGGGVAQALLGISALSKARGTWHTWHGIPTRVSIAPATLLKLPAQKKQAWEDLQAIQKHLTEGTVSK